MAVDMGERYPSRVVENSGLGRALVAICLLLAPAFATASSEPPAERPAAVYELPPERRAKAEAFARAKVTRYFVASLYAIALLALFVALGIGPRLRDLAEGVTSSPVLRLLIVAPALLAALGVLELPMAAWGHALALRYEQSVQGWASWLLDRAKAEAVGIVVATLAIALFFAIVRASPERWWLAFWAALQPLVVFLVFLQPLVVAPLFFEFRPLEETRPALTARIERVLARAGVTIPRERILEMNAAAKRRSLNAYVAGVGSSKRVVVWDTTLERLTEDETLFIFGHELAHYALQHIPRTLAVIAAFLLPVLFLASRLLEAIVGRFGGALGVRGVDDLAALPLLLLVLAVASFLATPLENAYSRWQEREADAYGLEAIRGVVDDPSSAAADAFRKLGEVALADPDPPAFVRFWLYSHPPIAERVAAAAGAPH
jgi:STE24 endopeptidase